MHGFESNDDFYDFVREFSHKLCKAGLDLNANKLRYLLDEAAWTTSSEILAELGRLFLDLTRKSAANLSPNLQSDLQRCICAVREVWPDLK